MRGGWTRPTRYPTELLLSALTNIGLGHGKFLGNTVAEVTERGSARRGKQFVLGGQKFSVGGAILEYPDSLFPCFLDHPAGNFPSMPTPTTKSESDPDNRIRGTCVTPPHFPHSYHGQLNTRLISLYAVAPPGSVNPKLLWITVKHSVSLERRHYVSSCAGRTPGHGMFTHVWYHDKTHFHMNGRTNLRPRTVNRGT